MAGVFRKAMVWLGLAPDEDYDDYGYEDQMRPVPGQPRPPAGYGAASPPASGGYAPPGGMASGGMAPGRQAPMGDEHDDPSARPARPVGRPGAPTARPTGAVRPMPPPSGRVREETPTVRPMRPTSAKPSVISPESFEDAKGVADRFKAEQPVVMDLASLDRDLARRLVDFASGICYGLGGRMERVRGGVLLMPSGVEVSDEERRRLRERR